MARRSFLLVLAGALSLGLALPATAVCAPPLVLSTWVTDVTATSARLRAEIDPGGSSTVYRFHYITLAAYRANLEATPPRDPFSGAATSPAAPAFLGAGTTAVLVSRHLSGLAPATPYRFRVVAENLEGTTIGPERLLGTEEATNAFRLPDGRGWELVSPAEKNGGELQPPGSIFAGGVFQAAAAGGALTYSSADSFASPRGAPPGSQYLARRGAGGWVSENLSAPLIAGGYGETPDGVPYQLFSADLSRALLTNGQRCRTDPGPCPVANPPLGGPGAPAGYRDYYLREGEGSFRSLLEAADLGQTSLGPTRLELELLGATPDLSHVLLSSCAALTADATELPAPGGCAGQNLYRWSGGALEALNLLPGDAETSPGAVLAAPIGALSEDGARVYLYQLEDGPLYLREAGRSIAIAGTTGGLAEFQTASADGRYAFYLEAGHLYRWDAESEASTDLTPSGGVRGMLGSSADGAVAYFQDAAGLRVSDHGATTTIAAGPEATLPSDYPPATATARVTPGGERLLFLSAAQLTGYDNTPEQPSDCGRLIAGAFQSEPCRQVFLYDATAGAAARLTCVSCNPTGERPQGAAGVPGVLANGSGPTAIRAYRPRALTGAGLRVFFTSADDLAIQDSNGEPDVYQWQAEGTGSCRHEGGCTALISSGRSPEASTFIDASADGSDVFFLTDSSLAFGDPGSYDVYDARIGGGFPAPPNLIPCTGDSCQALPEAPEDPTPGTLVPNSGNPPRHFTKIRQRRRHRHGRHKPHPKKHPHRKTPR